MSETEYHHGTLRNTGKTIAEYIDSLPEKKKPDLDDLTWYESLEDWARDELHGKVIIMDGKVWEAEDKKSDPDAGIFQAELQEDGSYTYVLQYYNGGCCWEEALLSALGKS